MRLPWMRRPVEQTERNRPHRFKAVSDSGAIIGMDPAGDAALQGIFLTKPHVDDGRCAICRRPRGHSIHEPEE